MQPVQCQYRSLIGGQPVCQIVADLMDRPLLECHTNDSACEYCVKCSIAPQVPNVVVASMAIGVALRSGDASLQQVTSARFRQHLIPAPKPITTCVLRGPETRTVACKPCQADSLVPVMMPVYRCPRHNECTLHNTGTFPKIQACATCGDRLEKYVELDVRQAPPAVLAAITQQSRPVR